MSPRTSSSPKPTAPAKRRSPKKTSSASSAKSQTLSIPAPGVAKKSRYKKVAKCDRKSNKGWAEGVREELLRQMVPAFLLARKEGWQAEAQKLKEIQNCYHNHFPYPMKDTDEPTGLVLDVNATNPVKPPELSPDDAKERLIYITEYNKVFDYLVSVVDIANGVYPAGCDLDEACRSGC